MEVDEEVKVVTKGREERRKVGHLLGVGLLGQFVPKWAKIKPNSQRGRNWAIIFTKANYFFNVNRPALTKKRARLACAKIYGSSQI